jgi:hypothetical protein
MIADPDPERREAMRAWLTSHRSLFEVVAQRPGHVQLRDVVGGALFDVLEMRGMRGVDIGDVAEMRLIGYQGDVVFARTFCFHPTGTREAIRGQVSRFLAEGRDRRDVIDYCASLRIRSIRYKHVSAVRVYETAGASLPGAVSSSGNGA